MQTTILLSIKPKFVEKIFAGLKRYEFRRVIFKSKSVSRVVVYASHPVKRVVGEFEVGGVLALSREQLWRETKEFSGIAKAYFDAYFQNKELAYAISIKSVKQYSRPITLQAFSPTTARPPQSFMYVRDTA
jgi:predicted transcriptional regulator